MDEYTYLRLREPRERNWHYVERRASANGSFRRFLWLSAAIQLPSEFIFWHSKRTNLPFVHVWRRAEIDLRDPLGMFRMPNHIMRNPANRFRRSESSKVAPGNSRKLRLHA